jgi:uncharacterized protein DUF2505
MTHFSIAHEFDTTPGEFFKLFLDEPYNVDLYDRIGVRERKVLERKEDERSVHWVMRIIPKRDLPALIKKVVGGDLGYTETATYHRDRDLIDITIEPTLLKERTKIKAIYTVKTIGGGRVRRTFEGDIHVDLPVVGRKVEATVLDDIRRSYDIAAQVTAEWLKKGK